MDVIYSPRVSTYSLGCIMRIYYILWVSLIASWRAVLGYREYTMLMHIDTMGFMHAKL